MRIIAVKLGQIPARNLVSNPARFFFHDLENQCHKTICLTLSNYALSISSIVRNRVDAAKTNTYSFPNPYTKFI